MTQKGDPIMQLDDRVRVNSKKEYDGRFYGMTGTLVHMTNTCDTILGAVQLDGQHNSASRYDAFWFPIGHLRRIAKTKTTEREDFIMPTSAYKTVLISFLSGANTDCTYPYACYDDTIVNDDTVVVSTGHHGFSLARIADANPKNPGKVQYSREVVCKVDFSAYEARKEKAQRAAQLRQQMDEKVKQLQTYAIYEMMADKDPALKAMLDEYKALNDGMLPGMNPPETN